MVGITEMPGIDDFGPAETFTLANATTVTNWAKAQGIARCPSGRCSATTAAARQRGGRQLLRHRADTWQFSQLMRGFTSGATSTPGSPSPSSASPSTPSSPSPSPSVSTPAGTAWAAGTAYQVGQIVTYNGKRYQCRQAHTAIVSWEPPNVLALWLPL